MSTFTRVPDEGSRSARIVLVGEAPGVNEMRLRRPFVGPSGKRLEEWWRMFGLSRDQFYITNVLSYQPKDIDRVPRDEIEQAMEALRERVNTLDDPWLIIPTGNYALYGLTGKGKVSWHHKENGKERPDILDWRGSILSYDGRIPYGGCSVKLIATVHPAAVLHAERKSASLGGWYEKVCRADWQRIASDSKFRELRLPEYDTRICPTKEEVIADVNAALARAAWLVVDIETPKRVKYFRPTLKKGGFGKRRRKVLGRYIACIGFCWGETHDLSEIDKLRSLTVPMTQSYWGEDYEEIIGAVACLLASNIPKVAQSGMFDFWWLLDEVLPVFDWIFSWKWDTRAMHQALNQIDVHDLGYMASFDTRQPYWKDLRDEKESGAWGPEKLDKYWTYCGTDCCVEAELFLKYLARLILLRRLAYYFERFASLFAPLLEIGRHGVRRDEARCTARREEYQIAAKAATERLEKVAGMPLIAKKALSSDRLCYFLYGPTALPGVLKSVKTKVENLLKKWPGAITLRLPKRYKTDKATKEKRITTDEVTVRRLMQRFPEQLADAGPDILDHRRNAKLLDFVSAKLVDERGRVVCQYSPSLTETGRLSSSTSPRDDGTNLQNQDREVRDVYIPDEDTTPGARVHPPPAAAGPTSGRK